MSSIRAITFDDNQENQNYESSSSIQVNSVPFNQDPRVSLSTYAFSDAIDTCFSSTIFNDRIENTGIKISSYVSKYFPVNKSNLDEWEDRYSELQLKEISGEPLLPEEHLLLKGLDHELEQLEYPFQQDPGYMAAREALKELKKNK